MFPWSKIKELESDLIVREEEIKRQEERHAKEIEALKQQHAKECEIIRTEVDELNEALGAANEEISAMRVELNRLRSNAQDLGTYRSYNKRLLQPVTPEEMAKAYPGFEFIVTPAFFKLKDEYDNSWLIERAGYLRRYTGFVANLFNTPDYTPLREDPHFQNALPKDIKSNLEIVFGEVRKDKVFRLCPPLSAKSIVVSFLAENTPNFQSWRDDNKHIIIVDTNSKQHQGLRQISVTLPFPVKLPTLQFDTTLDGNDCTAADLEHQRKVYDSQLRSACQHIYMRGIFLDTANFSTKRDEDEKDTKDDGQVKKSD